MKKIAAIIACLVTTGASASITFDIQAEDLRNSAGGIPSDALVLLVSDTARDGFASIADGSSLALNGFLNGGDDQILWRNSIQATTGGFAPGAFADFTTGLNLGGTWDAGDPLALLWFPSLTLASVQASGGDSYGFFSGPASAGSSDWVTPADGASAYKLYFFTDSATDLGIAGSLPSSAGNASLTVAAIPEPSRALLGMIGLTALGLRRRRR